MTDRQTEETPTTDRQTEESASAGADVPQGNEQEQLVHEIEETRAELGDTVDALAQKADVKARVSEKLEQRKAAWRDRQEEVKAKVNGAREQVSAATPDEAKRAASQVAHAAERRPWPAIAIAIVVGLLIGRMLGRR
jgi:ElaB/YqjD/DUF883 family membrane-anchored ribosome-binding protein